MTTDITNSSGSRDERSAVESLMDEILAESFPASDPPAWGSAAARIRRAETRDRAPNSGSASRPESSSG